METADADSDAQNEKESGAEPLANARHERFAVMVASGNVTVAEAYRQAVSARGSAKTSWENGSKLAAKVTPRIEWMKREVAKRFQGEAEAAILTIAEKRRFLARVMRCTPATEPHDSDLWNGVEAVDGVIKYKLPDKLRAIALDNDLAGEGAEAGGQKALAELVKRLRK